MFKKLLANFCSSNSSDPNVRTDDPQQRKTGTIEALEDENRTFRHFLSVLNIDPDALVKSDFNTCEVMGISCLRLVRDFSHSQFSERGIMATRQFLDTLTLDRNRAQDEVNPYRALDIKTYGHQVQQVVLGRLYGTFLEVIESTLNNLMIKIKPANCGDDSYVLNDDELEQIGRAVCLVKHRKMWPQASELASLKYVNDCMEDGYAQMYAQEIIDALLLQGVIFVKIAQ